ncbi:putative colanic acid biosynthesis acetyltransferase [Ruficoccus amylovorans]|uniref:Putative colanic acid biosynthesis acetyltransferase n=1 Tax=Ruficoccus amylovorans TaxID=1804625 RepID=A0A842HHX5_9BACT|nr:putative colanic acid biosynthesis acetyltransferase [Ruficoccus amylovorans]MBC2595598.1 putative colanic acid biosynthesis acetyltransferase [Ruficoccus amylovorans]
MRLPPKPVTYSFPHKAGRIVWAVVWSLFYRPTPRNLYPWRRLLLRCFGANIAPGAKPASGARIWAPWALTMEEGSTLGDYVDCYTQAPIVLRAHCTVSQYCFLCAGTHDTRRLDLPHLAAPIEIGAYAWVTADAFIGPGVTVGEGAVVGVRSTVLDDVEPWTVVAGTPAKFMKKRELDDTAASASPPGA